MGTLCLVFWSSKLGWKDPIAFKFYLYWRHLLLIKTPSAIYKVPNFLIRLVLNFDHVGTNNSMTHVMLMSAKVRRKEWLWETIDIRYVFGPTFCFNIHNHFILRNETTKKIAIFLNFYLATRDKFALTLCFFRYGAWSLRWSVMDASTLSELLSCSQK